MFPHSKWKPQSKQSTSKSTSPSLSQSLQVSLTLTVQQRTIFKAIEHILHFNKLCTYPKCVLPIVSCQPNCKKTFNNSDIYQKCQWFSQKSKGANECLFICVSLVSVYLLFINAFWITTIRRFSLGYLYKIQLWIIDKWRMLKEPINCQVPGYLYLVKLFA